MIQTVIKNNKYARGFLGKNMDEMKKKQIYFQNQDPSWRRVLSTIFQASQSKDDRREGPDPSYLILQAVKGGRRIRSRPPMPKIIKTMKILFFFFQTLANLPLMIFFSFLSVQVRERENHVRDGGWGTTKKAPFLQAVSFFFAGERSPLSHASTITSWVGRIFLPFHGPNHKKSPINV